MTLGDPERLLRSRAEEQLRARGSGDGHGALRYELEIHQVELQMQNEALRDACAELDTSRERYRELFEHAPVAYLTLDADGRIQDCNRAAVALLGEPVDRLRRKPLSTFVAVEHAETFEHHRREVLARDERCSCTLTLSDAEGRQCEVRVESARGRRGDLLWHCTMLDVTELHRLQRRLHDVQKLEAVGTLAGGVAHEFNNILTGVLGFAAVALEQLPAGTPGRAPIEQLQQVVMRGRSLAEQLLTFAHGGEGRNQAIELDTSLRSSEPVLRQILGPDVRLELQLDAASTMIRIDSGRFQQVLLNLASNARHAMPAGGSFRIETQRTGADALGRAAHAELGFRPCVLMKVSDTGVGMDAEARARAFEPFFTTKAVGMGTGLGLSLVDSAVRKTGGHIELDSEPGVGTTLQVYWPEATDAHPTQASGRESPRVRVRSVRALVVDDDPLVRSAIRQYLVREGLEVSEARSGEEGLAMLHEPEQTDVQLLVADVVLPGMKGVQLAAEARALRPQLAVLFISAHSVESLAERGWFEPVLPLLRKPFTAEELQHAVSDALAVQDWEDHD